jgi:hypothetical protein
MKIEDLMDLKTFEKNYLGNNSSTKDSLMFRIYARDMLDMIKTNLDKQIYRKKVNLQKEEIKKSRARSRSPHEGGVMGISMPTRRCT